MVDTATHWSTGDLEGEIGHERVVDRATPGWVRVAVVDDNDLTRSGLSAIIDAEPDLEIVGESAQLNLAATATDWARVDVVLLAVPSLEPGHAGVIRELRAQSPAPAVLVLGPSDDGSIRLALREGAAGYVVESASRRELVGALRAAGLGGWAFCGSTQARLVAAFLQVHETSDAPPALAQLTRREAEVFHELASGLSNAEIGVALHISEATVKKYVTRILAKCRLRDRVQAVILAHQHGWHVGTPAP